MDLLMVRDRRTGRFLYTERLVRRPGETLWEYVRRSVRREARLRELFAAETFQVTVGWGSGAVEDFLEARPEYGAAAGRAGERRPSGPPRPRHTIGGR